MAADLATTAACPVVPERDDRAVRLEGIQAFQRELAKVEQREIPTAHNFAPGIYTRSVFLPKDTVAVGAIHRHAHLMIMSQGDMLVETEDGLERVQGFRIFHSPAGIKRMVQTFEDTIVTTVHHTNLTDLDAIWHEMTVPEPDPFTPLIEGEGA